MFDAAEWQDGEQQLLLKDCVTAMTVTLTWLPTHAALTAFTGLFSPNITSPA